MFAGARIEGRGFPVPKASTGARCAPTDAAGQRLPVGTDGQARDGCGRDVEDPDQAPGREPSHSRIVLSAPPAASVGAVGREGHGGDVVVEAGQDVGRARRGDARVRGDDVADRRHARVGRL